MNDATVFISVHCANQDEHDNHQVPSLHTANSNSCKTSQTPQVRPARKASIPQNSRCATSKIFLPNCRNGLMRRTSFTIRKKVENGIKDNTNDLQVQESSWTSRAGKLEKSLRKAMQRVGKERRQSDKKLQGALETYLIELTGFKGKAGSSCAASIRQLRELQKDVESLQREAKRQTQLSQDIYRKVHSQFKSQIDEISSNLDEEERERTQSEQQLFDSIQRMYQTLNGAILQGRKLRERQQREVVDLLDRVIQKLRREMASD